MAIGDRVATLFVAGAQGATYTLLANPDGYFAISGNEIVEAADSIPAGTYKISIQAVGSGFSIIQPATLTTSGSQTGPILDLSQQSNVELFPGAL